MQASDCHGASIVKMAKLHSQTSQLQFVATHGMTRMTMLRSILLIKLGGKGCCECLRNCLGQQVCQSCEGFERRFQNVNSWFHRHQRHINQSKRINASNEQLAEPPEDTRQCHHKAACESKSSWSHLGLTMAMDLTSLDVSVDLGGSKIVACCQQVFLECWQWALKAN